MSFDYSLYFRGCFVLPIFYSLFSALIFVSIMLHVISTTVREGLSFKFLLPKILGMVICVFLLCLNICRLLQGGVYLIVEQREDAVKINGIITNIDELGLFSFPELESEYDGNEHNGVIVNVSGVLCTAVTCGDFEVGDKVEIEYLPKSGYLLSIISTESEAYVEDRR